MDSGLGSPKSGSELLEATQEAGSVASSQASSIKQSRPLGKLLSEAVQLWLRSQVEKIDQLKVTIDAGVRQILSGRIPGVSVDAKGAVYQGLQLTEIHVVATGIGINVGEVIRGKPLRLLEPIPIVAELLLQQADLNASLQAPLFSNALIEFLLPFLLPTSVPRESARSPLGDRLENAYITLDTDQLTLSAQWVNSGGEGIAFVLRTGLQLASRHELQFVNTDLQLPPGVSGGNLEGFKLDFGSEVALEELSLSPGQLLCRGRIKVIP